MKPYYYIRGLKVYEKFYNKDKLDIINYKANNIYYDKAEALADVNAIYNKLQKLKEMFAN